MAWEDERMKVTVVRKKVTNPTSVAPLPVQGGFLTATSPHSQWLKGTLTYVAEFG